MVSSELCCAADGALDAKWRKAVRRCQAECRARAVACQPQPQPQPDAGQALAALYLHAMQASLRSDDDGTALLRTIKGLERKLARLKERISEEEDEEFAELVRVGLQGIEDRFVEAQAAFDTSATGLLSARFFAYAEERGVCAFCCDPPDVLELV